MKKSDVNKLPPGIYRLHWKTYDCTSIAAVGVTEDGDRWMAPTNWTSPTTNRAYWRMVKKADFLKIVWPPG